LCQISGAKRLTNNKILITGATSGIGEALLKKLLQYDNEIIGLLLPLLKQNDNAAIINVSSGLGLVPKMQAPVYCSTKAGLHIFSKALRYQLDHVKVFEIIPPLVETKMTTGRGKNKISPEELAAEFVQAFKCNHYEISIGKVKLLKLLNRVSPLLAENIMRRG